MSDKGKLNIFGGKRENRDFSWYRNPNLDLKVDFGSKTSDPTQFTDLHRKIAETNPKSLNDSEML